MHVTGNNICTASGNTNPSTTVNLAVHPTKNAPINSPIRSLVAGAVSLSLPTISMRTRGSNAGETHSRRTMATIITDGHGGCFLFRDSQSIRHSSSDEIPMKPGLARQHEHTARTTTRGHGSKSVAPSAIRPYHNYRNFHFWQACWMVHDGIGSRG